MGEPLRVMLIASDPLVRSGLAALLSNRSDCRVVGQVGTDTDVISGVDVYCPEVLLWDAGWESLQATRSSHLDCLAELWNSGIGSVVLLQDMHAGADVWHAGARGLLMRQVKADRLVAALQAVTQGLLVWDETLTRATPMMAADTLSDHSVLTPREYDVLQLLAEGLPNKIVADRLRISEHTVKFHVNAIMGKLGAHSRTEAVVRATRRGLLML